jgi:hypothetical protein
MELETDKETNPPRTYQEQICMQEERISTRHQIEMNLKNESNLFISILSILLY